MPSKDLLSPASGYRADIDGLRALAITSVVLFHYGIPGLSGGFVGVDVFFVISGYLITGIIAREMRAGSFSLRGFYERRIRRIFPALIIVTLATFCAGLALMAPRDMKELGTEIVCSALFSSNVWFYRKDNYFDGVSTMRPLLHSWSLAVEEQFYIVIPLALRWIKLEQGGRDRTFLVLLAVSIVSLAIGIVSVDHWPRSAFYLLPARAWELLCGGLLAVGRPRPPTPIQAECAAIAGFAAIVIAILGFTPSTPFPGYAALLPCLGAVALIWAGEGQSQAMVSRLFSRPLPVWIGRISYPLYMWHWPILVLSRYGLFHEPDLRQRLALIALAVLLAAATTHLIEAPIRSRRMLATRPSLLCAGVASLIGLMILGGGAKYSDGFRGRLSPQALALTDQDRDRSSEFCNPNVHDKIRDGTACGVGDWKDGSRPDFLVWGDSHAWALIPAFKYVATDLGLRGLILDQPGCEPLLGVSAMGPNGADCREFNAAVIASLREHPVPVVFLVGLWAKVAEGRPTLRLCAGRGGENGGIIDIVTGIASANGSHRAFANGLDRTLSALNADGVKPILLQDTPCQFTEIPSALGMALMQHRSIASLREKRATIERSQAWVDQQLAGAAQAGRARFLRTRDRLCGSDDCPIEDHGIALYRDSSHLSVAGALRLVPVLLQAFKAPRSGS